MGDKSVRLVNIALHGITLGTRFLFIFFLAKHLDPELVGYYGIFVATVGYSLYFVGLDFYTYVSREIIKTPPHQRGRLLKGQAALSGILYVMLLPLAVIFLNQAAWPGHLVWWFLPILLLEHLNQEMSRLLVALSEQLTASLISFVRQGSWTLITIVLMSVREDARNLDIVVTLWGVGGLAAAGFGFLKLKQLKTEGWRQAVDWAWVKKGILVSSAFLSATLALRGIQTFDRYWIEALGGIKVAGAYVLLFGVAGTLLVFLDAALFSFSYPALIKHIHNGENDEAQRKVTQLFFQTLGFSALFSVTSWALLPYLLAWLDNPVYQQNLHWYPWLLSAMVLNAAGMVPHYALYARQKDRAIISSHFASLIAFCSSTWMLSLKYSSLAVIMGLNVAFAVIMVWKAYAYWLVLQEETSHKLATQTK